MLFPARHMALPVGQVVGNLSEIKQQRRKIEGTISSIAPLSAPKSVREDSPSFDLVAKPFYRLTSWSKLLKQDEKKLSGILESRLSSYLRAALREHALKTNKAKITTLQTNSIQPRSFEVFLKKCDGQISVSIKAWGRHQGIFITSPDGNTKQFAITDFMHAKRHLLAEFDQMKKAAGQR